MSYNEYIPISKENFDTLMDRFNKWQPIMERTDCELINVYDPLGPQQVEELLFIRELSVELQKKRDEDLKKAQQAAEVEAKAAAEAAKETDVNGNETAAEA